MAPLQPPSIGRIVLISCGETQEYAAIITAVRPYDGAAYVTMFPPDSRPFTTVAAYADPPTGTAATPTWRYPPRVDVAKPT
jgi:hypothetical protein